MDHITFAVGGGNLSKLPVLTHRGRMPHTCVSKPTIISSDNGLSPGRRQVTIWTNAGMLLVWNLGANFSEVLSEIHSFLFKKMQLKMSSAKWWQFCLGLNMLSGIRVWITHYVHDFLWDPKLNGVSVRAHGWVITFRNSVRMKLHIHALNHCSFGLSSWVKEVSDTMCDKHPFLLIHDCTWTSYMMCMI